MNIHEYQAKKLLSQFKTNVPQGKVAYTPLEAKKNALLLSDKGPWVLKAQIQAGARAKGHFLDQDDQNLSGIMFIKNRKDLITVSQKMLGHTLVTPQTGPKGKLVSKIYVETFSPAKQLFYLSFVINRIEACITLLVANETDNILDLAQKESGLILKINLDINERIKKSDVMRVLSFLNLPENLFDDLKTFLQNLYKAFICLDATMLEINPVGITKDNRFIALDAKISFDDNALFRHQDVVFMHDDYEVGENVLRASKCGFKYREFEDGNIGLIVNGDGLALAVHDYLKQMNQKTACYLNIKGGVDEDKIAQSLKIMMTNPKVEGIIINILGGFLRCDLVADGIISAVSEIGLNIPLVARFEGTNKETAKEILEKHHFNFLTADSLQEAALKLTHAMKEND
ncbi:MAG: succinate--CoA ligase subunit beta [Alphaproteobacteria bacterium]|nr:succinate--CoA ligase subunit beta [Alphaproteobacteria bacterium]